VKRTDRRNGAPAFRRLLPAAYFALCFICAAVPAAPQAQPGRAPTTRPSARPAEASPARAASASQPATTRPAVAGQSEIERGTIRLDRSRTDAARSAPTTQPTRPVSTPGFDFPRVAGALAVVLGLIFALRWLLRRSMNPASLPGATNAVQVLTRSPISPRQQLLLLRVGRRLLVVSDCNGQLNSLSEITDADEVAALIGQLRDEKLTSASRSFGNLLGMWRRGAEATEEDGEADGEGESFPRAAPDVPRRHAASDDEGSADSDPEVASAHSEIRGLMERVRSISHQFKP
jgi:flagellar biogenesis protein FliO